MVKGRNVRVKWFIEESRSLIARKILEKGAAFIAPDTFIPEICNRVWEKGKKQEITAEQGQAIVSNMPTVLDDFAPFSDLANRAFVLAVQYNTPGV